jgi:hypothetical protein
VPALEPEVPVTRLLDRLLALGRHRQGAVLELDRDLVLGDPGQVEGVDELVLGLPHVDGGDPALGAAIAVEAVAVGRALEEGVHQPAHLRLERRELAERLPANQRCHPFFLLRALLPTAMARIKPER